MGPNAEHPVPLALPWLKGHPKAAIGASRNFLAAPTPHHGPRSGRPMFAYLLSHVPGCGRGEPYLIGRFWVPPAPH